MVKVIGQYNDFWPLYNSWIRDEPARELIAPDTIWESLKPPPLDLGALQLGPASEHTALIEKMGLSRANFETQAADSAEAF